jgi:exosortase
MAWKYATSSITDIMVPGRHRMSKLPTAHTHALVLWLLSLLLFWPTLHSMGSLMFHDENSAHILLIPVISAVLIYLQRRRIFQVRRDSLFLPIPLLVTVVVLWYSLHAELAFLNARDHLSAEALFLAVLWIALFLVCYGPASSKAAAFPLSFLFLMVPLPQAVTRELVSLLQAGSAGACAALFRLLGVPFLRHGFQFSLPGLDIEVGESCSGIHSGLSLLIVGLLAGHIFLRGRWRKVCFALCILPIAIFKNAVRIVTIAWLGIHVNPDILQGPVHRQGGLPFSIVALVLMMMLLWLLSRLPGSSSRASVLKHPG